MHGAATVDAMVALGFDPVVLALLASALTVSSRAPRAITHRDAPALRAGNPRERLRRTRTCPTRP